MIEWVPIKDWKFKEYQPCIISYKRENTTSFFSLIHDKDGLLEHNSNGWKVTHIAAINPPPAEKTLEEKFEEFRVDVNKGTIHAYDLKGYTYSLAQIAKQHYEYEKELKNDR